MTHPEPAGFRPGAVLRGAVLSLVLSVAMAGCAAFGQCGLRECPADAKISADVSALLAQSPALGSPSPISVHTVNGVVYLRGLVSTPFQIAEGGSIAERAPGVVSVENHLTIDNSH